MPNARLVDRHVARGRSDNRINGESAYEYVCLNAGEASFVSAVSCGSFLFGSVHERRGRANGKDDVVKGLGPVLPKGPLRNVRS